MNTTPYVRNPIYKNHSREKSVLVTVKNMVLELDKSKLESMLCHLLIRPWNFDSVGQFVGNKSHSKLRGP